MHLAHLLLLVSGSSALLIPSYDAVKGSISNHLPTALKTRQTRTCPAVWRQIAAELRPQFRGLDLQCTDLARAAIRAAFHDCGSWEPGVPNTGCDGSLFLAPVERTRLANQGLNDIIPLIGALAKKFDVSVADAFQFAAAATKLCPLGPTVQTFVGRTDNSDPDDTNLLPSPFSNSSSIIARFAAIGFSPTELAALVGAHTTSRQFNVDKTARNVGKSQDSTLGIWDTLFYAQTLRGNAPFTFQSDINLSQDPRTGPSFQNFAINKIGWDAAFAPAMTKLSLLGVSGVDLIDCTSALP